MDKKETNFREELKKKPALTITLIAFIIFFLIMFIILGFIFNPMVMLIILGIIFFIFLSAGTAFVIYNEFID